MLKFTGNQYDEPNSYNEPSYNNNNNDQEYNGPPAYPPQDVPPPPPPPPHSNDNYGPGYGENSPNQIQSAGYEQNHPHPEPQHGPPPPPPPSPSSPSSGPNHHERYYDEPSQPNDIYSAASSPKVSKVPKASN